MSFPRKAVAYTMLGTALAVTAAHPFALAKDIAADLPEVPGFSFNAATAVGTASLSATSTVYFGGARIPDTTLDDVEYVAFENHGSPVITELLSDDD